MILMNDCSSFSLVLLFYVITSLAYGSVESSLAAAAGVIPNEDNNNNNNNVEKATRYLQQPQQQELPEEEDTSTTAAATTNNNSNDVDSYNYRAIYKGRFQLFANGCSSDDETPRLTAVCAGNSIDLLVTSHPSIVCDEPQMQQDEGGGTVLSCYSTCSSSAANSEECAKETYLNDGSYTTAEGPWGEIIYQCLGHTLGDVDSHFHFEASTGKCQWQWFFDNELYHMAQLGILCDPKSAIAFADQTPPTTTPTTTPSAPTSPTTPATTTTINIIDMNENNTLLLVGEGSDNITNNNNSINNNMTTMEEPTEASQHQEDVVTDSSSTLLSRVSIHNDDFKFDDYYLECSRGDSMMIDYAGVNGAISCGIGRNCGGEDCSVDFHTITVHADLPHAFFCVQHLKPNLQLNPSEITNFQDIASAAPLPIQQTSSQQQATPPPASQPESGNYTIQFQAAWSLLMKNPHYWYDNSDYEYYREADTTLAFKCANDGIIQLVATSNPWIVCTRSPPDMATLNCRVSLQGEEGMINSIYSVTYNCTTSNKLPTTFAMYESNTMAVIEDVFDDLVVGHALQLGHYCSSNATTGGNDDNNSISKTTTTTTEGIASGEFRFQDYDYECGFPSDHYLLLDSNTEVAASSGGDQRFTCLETVPITEKGILITVPPVGMRSEWRLEEDNGGGGLGLDPHCYVFEPTISG